ncbi:TorF family putative porin [Microbulbifer sp. M83]|uniref:TorF family putative porin n=1 Tax=unclassified Microbulbifer TaxID=2619833 RepID=UPI002FE40894
MHLSTGRNLLVSVALIAALLPLASFAQEPEEEESEEPSFGTFGGSAMLASDYMFRSISNSNLRPQVQADMNWSHDAGFYLGVWASNTDFGGAGNSMELDPYVGMAGNFGESNFSYDIGYWSYNYPGSEFSLNYGEVYVYVTWTLDDFSITPSVWYADNYFGEDFLDEVSALAYEVTLAYQLPDNFSASVRVGEQTFESAFDNLNYVYYDLGMDYTIEDWTMDLRWYDTDGVDPFLANPKLADGEWVFSITRSF